MSNNRDDLNLVKDYLFSARYSGRLTKNELVDSLRARFGRHSRDKLDEVILKIISEVYKCPLIEGERKAQGRLVLDSGNSNFEAARRAKNRLIKSIFDPDAQPTIKSKNEIEILKKRISSFFLKLPKNSDERKIAIQLLEDSMKKFRAGLKI